MLIYVGGGFIPGVPARDLTEEELRELAERFDRKDFRVVLVESGLYEERTNQKIDHRVRENKMLDLDPEVENK